MAYARAWNLVEATGRREPVWVEPFDERRLALRCIVSQPATLVRRSAWEAVGGLDESLHMVMDYDLWWRLYRRCGAPCFVDAVTGVNREHAGTKTRRQSRAPLPRGHRRGAPPLRARAAEVVAVPALRGVVQGADRMNAMGSQAMSTARRIGDIELLRARGERVQFPPGRGSVAPPRHGRRAALDGIGVMRRCGYNAPHFFIRAPAC
jgi:hypothetical protein